MKIDLKIKLLVSAILLLTGVLIAKFLPNEKYDKGSLSTTPVGLTILESDLPDSEKLKSFLNSKKFNISRIFVRIDSSLKFSCQSKSGCKAQENKRTQLDRIKQILEQISEFQIPTSLVYNIPISNFTDAPFGETGPHLTYTNRSKFIFANPAFQIHFEKDLKSLLSIFSLNSLIFGIDLGSYFLDTQNTSEIESFWNLIFKIKSHNPTLPVSTAFNFEHLRSYNFWGTLGHDNLKNLDFFAFTSYPIFTNSKLRQSIDPNMVSFWPPKGDLSSEYYQDISINLSPLKEIFLVDFRMVLDSTNGRNQNDFIKSLLHSETFKTVSFPYVSENWLHNSNFLELKKLLPLWDGNFSLTSTGLLFAK